MKKKKLAKGTSQLTMERLRKSGWNVQKVEYWNPFAKVRVDLWGIIDVLAMRNGHLMGVQATTRTQHAAHRTKMLESEFLDQWVSVRSRSLELWSWDQPKGKGTAYRVKIEEFYSGRRSCLIDE